MESRIDSELRTDVLVVGGGASGARAAIESARRGAATQMVVKGIFGAGGCSLSPSIASAIGPWKAGDDSTEQHFEDMVVRGKQYLCDQELAKQQAEQAGEALLELEQWGLVWDRDTSGHIALFPSKKLFPGTAGHDRWITFGRMGSSCVGPFWTGHGVVDTLRDEVNRRDVPYMQETIVSEIFLSNKRISGALAYDYLNGRIVLFRCKAIVLATGDASQVYYPHTMVSRESTGDGFALAYNAGACLYDMEQFEYLSMNSAFPDAARAKAVMETLTESGDLAYVKNANGERFLPRYGVNEELASQEDIAKAIFNEVKEGRGGPHGGCFIDLRHIPRSILARGMPGRLEHIERLGYDTRKDLIEVFPVIHTTTGGVRINERCETDVPGLFAAGQVAFAVNDCLGEGATGIVDAVFRGKISGASAADYAKSVDSVDPPAEAIERGLQTLLRPLRSEGGPTPVSIIRQLQRSMWKHVGLVKNEGDLNLGLDDIIRIRDEILPEVSTRIKSGRFNIEALEAIELRHMLIAAEAITRSSMTRKESRNRFHRSDYPLQDDKNWLKHIVIRKGAAGMETSLEPVRFPYLAPPLLKGA